MPYRPFCGVCYFIAMDKEKFKLRLDLKTGDEEVDLYIYTLHNYLVNFETSSVKQMLIALDNIAQKITDDLDKIFDGNLTGLEVLAEDSKIFDKVQKIVEKIESWKKVSEMAESLRPEIEERKGEVKKSIVIDINKPIVEQLQEKHWKKNKGGV